MTKWLKYILLFVVLAAFFSLMINKYIIGIYTVHQNSMVPTLHPGDKILFTKFNVAQMVKGDLALFELDGQKLVKRCVAMPGDTFKILLGKAYVNGILIDSLFAEPTQQSKLTRSLDELVIFKTYGKQWTNISFGPLVIPKRGEMVGEPELSPYRHIQKENVFSGGSLRFTDDYFFFMGDNRGHSVDSRNFGLIRGADIIGIAKSYNPYRQ